MKTKQEIYVGCMVPEKGKSSVGVMVLGQEEELVKTFVVVCSGGNPIESRPVEVYELNWEGLPTQKVGYVRIFIDPTYLNSELSVYSCLSTSDSEDSAVRSRPYRFRI